MTLTSESAVTSTNQPFDPASAPKPPEQKPVMRSRRGGKDDAQGSLF